jgi:hypothetical protein
MKTIRLKINFGLIKRHFQSLKYRLRIWYLQKALKTFFNTSYSQRDIAKCLGTNVTQLNLALRGRLKNPRSIEILRTTWGNYLIKYNDFKYLYGGFWYQMVRLFLIHWYYYLGCLIPYSIHYCSLIHPLYVRWMSKSAEYDIHNIVWKKTKDGE